MTQHPALNHLGCATLLLFATASQLCGQQSEEALLQQLPDAPSTTFLASMDQPLQGLSKSSILSGSVFGPNGGIVAHAIVTIRLDTPNAPIIQTVLTGDDGSFIFNSLPAGNYIIRFEAAGFTPQELHQTLIEGRPSELPKVTLTLAPNFADAQVTVTSHDIAQQQIADQEKQRVFGAIPNFYVSYVPDPEPLAPGQKFHLAWKSIFDPSAFAITGIIAGVQQATETYPGYGEGAEGYAKRYGAAYAGFVSGTLIGGAILPTLFKQDPRYFYQGTGTIRSRALHAIARSVITRGDNKKPQIDYSSILGGLAAGGLSNLYYPANDRNGAGLTFANAAIGIGGSAMANLFQEFLVRKLSTGVPKTKSNQP